MHKRSDDIIAFLILVSGAVAVGTGFVWAIL